MKSHTEKRSAVGFRGPLSAVRDPLQRGEEAAAFGGIHGLLKVFKNLMVWACVLLLACSPAPTPLPSPTPGGLPSATVVGITPSAPTATATATATLTASKSPAPTFTLTLLPSLTLTPSQTLTATPAADFAHFQIIAVDSTIGGIQVVIRLPGIQIAYQVKIHGHDYACVLADKVPDRLFCSGLATVPFDQTLEVLFSDPASGQVVFSGETIFSSALNATALPIKNGLNDCAQRGQNVHCEVECRLLANGSPCIVATCADACGLYRSIQTCPQDMPSKFASCPPELFAQMKARYNLP